MTTQATYNYEDFSAESTSGRLHFPVITAGNFDSVKTSISQMQTLTNSLSNGAPRRQSVQESSTRFDGPQPTLPTAQREIKCLVTYQDNVTTDLYQTTIPVFNYEGVVANTDLIDVSGGDWTAYIAGLEANCVSPAGNAITFIRAQLVGRSS